MLKRIFVVFLVLFLMVPQVQPVLAEDGNNKEDLSNITNITALGRRTAAFNVAVPAGSTDIAAKLISEGRETQGEIDAAGLLKFKELTPDTHYQLTVYNTDTLAVIDQIAFKTFNAEGTREFQYFADVRNGDTGIVDVKIFVNFSTKGTIRMKRIQCHESELDLRLTGDITADGYAVEANPEDYSFSATAEANKTAVIEYSSDRSYRYVSSHGSQGILTGNYFMCSGEQFLIMPNNQTYTSGYLYSFSFITREGWHCRVDMDATEYETLFVSDAPVETAINYYAYDASCFDETEKVIDATPVTAVIDKNLTQPYADVFFEVYETLCALWGGDVSDTPYTFMVIHDNRNIYAGEFDGGQGFSNFYGIGEMVVHQTYHRWQGWCLGIPYDEGTGENRGFWIEGFNEYYCCKILNNLETLSLNGSNDLRGYYNRYVSQVRSGTDTSLLKEKQLDSDAVYSKGACLAYLLDLEIQEKSGGEYSLDDVLKYFYHEYMTNQTAFTYQRMLKCIRTFIGEDIDIWWDTYLVENEQFEITDFSRI